VETEKLIEALSADLSPAPSRQVSQGIGRVAVLSGLVTLSLVIWWLGLRADLMDALHGPMLWIKATYAAILGLGGYLALERLSRPAGTGRTGLILAVTILAVLLSAGALQLMATAPDARMALWMGKSAHRCPVWILILALPVLAGTLLVVRRFAPTRLAMAGGAAGLFAGGVAATAYGLHCPETSVAFLATWYSLGVLLSTGLGAALGPWVLRWR
jgi:hypothetical protein